jgi:hypothetical protein
LACAAAIDEAAGIRDTAARVQAYAKIRDDFESQQRFAEIRLRACQRIGEISRDLEKGEKIGGAGKFKVPSDGKFKSETLAEAGISTSTAQRSSRLLAVAIAPIFRCGLSSESLVVSKLHFWRRVGYERPFANRSLRRCKLPRIS